MMKGLSYSLIHYALCLMYVCIMNWNQKFHLNILTHIDVTNSLLLHFQVVEIVTISMLPYTPGCIMNLRFVSGFLLYSSNILLAS